MKLLKGNSGKPSYTTTMAMIAFGIACLAIVIGVIEKISVGGVELSFRMIDAGVIAAILTPVLGVYGWRRHDENNGKHGEDKDETK